MLVSSQVNFQSVSGATDFLLNDRTSLKTGFAIAPYYYICIDSSEGIYGNDIEVETHTIPHGIGEKSGDGFQRGKGFALSGYIQGRNYDALEAASDHLQQTFWQQGLRKLVWTHRGTQIYLFARVVNSVAIVQANQSHIPRWTWTVGLRADDPRFKKYSDNTLYYSWQT